jgi:hypothetical protein
MTGPSEPLAGRDATPADNSGDHRPTVDTENLGGDELRRVGREIHSRGGNICRSGELPFQHRLAGDLAHQLALVGEERGEQTLRVKAASRTDVMLGILGQSSVRRDGIHSDAVLADLLGARSFPAGRRECSSAC